MEWRQNGLRSIRSTYGERERQARHIRRECKFTPSTSFEWAKNQTEMGIKQPSKQASKQHHQNNDMREIHPFGRDDARTNTNMYTQFIRSFDSFFHFFIMIFYDVCMFYLFAEHNFCFGVGGGGGRGAAAAAKAKCVCIHRNTKLSVCRYRFGIM